MKNIKIDTDHIKLDQLLKLSNIADSGGHAKILILSGEVKLNGKVELQRGKKIRSGDIVSFKNEVIQVI